MLRRIIWFAPIILFAAYAFLGTEPGEYRDGYEQAVQDIGEARDKLRWMTERGGGVVQGIESLPLNGDRSEKWNDGYRQALLDQFPDGLLQR